MAAKLGSGTPALTVILLRDWPEGSGPEGSGPEATRRMRNRRLFGRTPWEQSGGTIGGNKRGEQTGLRAIREPRGLQHVT